ncbi:MAG: Holliday junction resolvase RuvX [Crocinitomicaceae bacterium]|jgi:putative Holliday junction resolvase|nr:Holliday junction resolvase RuvX [Crocinitomicaceae bacterium]
MSVVLCIDFGLKRCGLALSDPNRIIASPLQTIESIHLENWLEQEIPKRQIEEIVLGYPTRLDGSDSHVTENVRLLKSALEKKFPVIPIKLFDERFSSKMASEAIYQMGHKKKKHDKSLVDQVAAAMILQEYLGQS